MPPPSMRSQWITIENWLIWDTGMVTSPAPDMADTCASGCSGAVAVKDCSLARQVIRTSMRWLGAEES